MLGVERCRATEVTYGRHTRSVILENELLRAVVLADKGADIYELTYKPRGIDVLWKAPWGMKEIGSLSPSAADSQIAWMDHYAGGWQELFPNGGPACVYRGIEMPMHGEVSTAPWDYDILSRGGDEAKVRFGIATTRTPFRLERTMSIAAGRPEIVFAERLVNEGDLAMDFMWGHHPAYGLPFLGANCRLDAPAGRVVAHPFQIFPDRSWMPGGGEWKWPNVTGKDGQVRDLSQIPGPDAKVNTLSYLTDLREGWYGLTNTDLGFGVGLVWPKAVFPWMWLWQELNGSLSHPWWGRTRVMGVEIWTSMPSSGLVAALESGTARQLGPGGELDVTFRCVFYETKDGVRRISPEGEVETL